MAVAPMAPRYVLVTGGNRGIGRAVCARLLQAATGDAPVAVLLAGRDLSAAEAAAAELRASLPAGGAVHALRLDVADPASRRAAGAAAREVMGGATPLAALVNNAGVALDLPWSPPPPPGGTGEVAERTLATNFVGAVALTRELLEVGLLQRGSRVVSVSSGGGHIAIHRVLPEVKARFLAPDLSTDGVLEAARGFVADAARGGKDALQEKWGYSHCYGFSKLCLTTACRTMAREHPELVVHGCTPGFIQTGMTTGSAATGTPDEGAEIVAYLVLSGDEAVLESGKFWNPQREVLAWDDERYVAK